jgi:hypothetical protein
MEKGEHLRIKHALEEEEEEEEEEEAEQRWLLSLITL